MFRLCHLYQSSVCDSWRPAGSRFSTLISAGGLPPRLGSQRRQQYWVVPATARISALGPKKAASLPFLSSAALAGTSPLHFAQQRTRGTRLARICTIALVLAPGHSASPTDYSRLTYPRKSTSYMTQQTAPSRCRLSCSH